MSLPTLEQYRSGATTWRREHEQIIYNLAHWGVSDYQPQGIWNYYLYLPENMFQRPEDFALFNLEPKVSLGYGDKFRQDYDYYSIPDLELSGGITFYDRLTGINPATGEPMFVVKVGCDYNHLWNGERGYSEDMEEVDRDAKRSLDVLVSRYALNRRCAYSGVIDHPSTFYLSNAGYFIHNSRREALIAEGHPAWMPKEGAV